MKHYKSKDEIPVPPADIILDLLNDEPGTDEKFLHFYDGYIRVLSTEQIYSHDGIYEGYYIDEDLMQEIKIALIRGLPVLRKVLINKLSSDQAIVVIVT